MTIHFLSKVATRPLLMAVVLLWAVEAKSANFSFRGTFNQDDNVQLIAFTLTSPGTVTIRSFGYEGGTNAAGAVIPAGGFDTTLALFNSLGTLVAFNDDGPDRKSVV